MRWLPVLLILMTFSCSEKNPMNDGSSDGTGTAVIRVVIASGGIAKAASAQATKSARVFFYKSNGSPVVDQPLAMSGLSASGTVKVKAGTYRVEVKGYDSSVNVTYFGSRENVSIKGGKTITVQITLKKPGQTDIKMVPIPGGNFSMGSNDGHTDEKPVHIVTLSAFEMSSTEITQGQFKVLIGTNPANSYGVGDNYPVYYVSWNDAVKFCNKLSVKAGFDKCYNESTGVCDFTKNGFRLPTEAEWEYTCRAGTTTKYYTGDSESDLDRAGWYSSNSSSKTHPVEQKEPNVFGLYDMHGNVFEWCNDWYGSYQNGSANNPTGAQTGSDRVLRGGGWFYSASGCRSAIRDVYYPGDRGGGIGFRVVRCP